MLAWRTTRTSGQPLSRVYNHKKSFHLEAFLSCELTVANEDVNQLIGYFVTETLMFHNQDIVHTAVVIVE